MNNSVDSSPLQRLGIFLLGLMAFTAFGVVAWLGFKVTSGDNDAYYEQKSEERKAKVMASHQSQEGEVIPENSDLEAFADTLINGKPQITKKPVPGTEAFNEWMKKHAEKQAANSPVKPDTKEENPKEGVVELTLKALGDPPGTMKFEQADLIVKAGSKVKLKFENPDLLQHNFVLTKIGKKEVVGALADAMLTDPEALKKHYVPKSDDVIASTKLVNPTQSEVIEFTVPNEPGDYPYICTFPGHWRLMSGILKVTK
ncbi:MAG: hypothetical protein HN584_06145 [Akkermansiaceae bacterium]|nr:hypothetical protein [Akkermansiaceae bacterium]